MSRVPDKTSRRAAVLVLAVQVVSLRGAAAVAQEKPKLPTFPSQVELITVDVVVVDAAGRPVPGLTRDDFVVKEDGRAQEIASFEPFVLEPPDAPAEPPAVATNEPAPGRSTGRAFSLLVDDVRIAPERTEVARAAIQSFLERSVRDGDLVTLRTSSGDVSWTARVPEGTEDLVAVASRTKGRDIPAQSVDRMSEYEAFQIANREDSPSMAAEGIAAPGGAQGRAPAQPTAEAGVPGTGLGATRERVKARWLSALLCIPSNCDSLVRARAMEIDAQRRNRLRVTLEAVRRELAALALGHGRKSLLLLSDGFLEDYGSDLREVAAASRQANTAIYFLDARGLVAKPGFGSADEVTSFTLPDPRDQVAMGFEDSVLLAAGGADPGRRHRRVHGAQHQRPRRRDGADRQGVARLLPARLLPAAGQGRARMAQAQRGREEAGLDRARAPRLHTAQRAGARASSEEGPAPARPADRARARFRAGRRRNPAARDGLRARAAAAGHDPRAGGGRARREPAGLPAGGESDRWRESR